MVNALGFGVLGALGGFANAEQQQLQQQAAYKEKMDMLNASLGNKQELQDTKTQAYRDVQSAKNDAAQAKTQAYLDKNAQAMDFAQQKFGWQQQYQSTQQSLAMMTAQLNQQKSINEINLGQAKLEQTKASMENSVDSANQGIVNNALKSSQDEVNSYLKSQDPTILQQYNIDPSDPQLLTKLKAASRQNALSSMPQKAQDYAQAQNVDLTPADTLAANAPPTPAPQPGMLARILGTPTDTDPSTLSAPTQANASAPQAASPQAGLPGPAAPAQPSPQPAVDSQAGGYPEGTQLQGPGGTYIVQNGIPVLQQPASQ